MKLFVQSTLDSERRFEVLSFNPETKKGMLKSVRYGSEFDADLSKEWLIKNGYKLVRIEEEDHAQQS